MSIPSDSRRHRLGQRQRLKSRKRIELLFREGRSLTAGRLRMVARLSPEGEPALQAGFTVSSRNFKRAVDRNRIKRLLREVWRLGRQPLEELVSRGSLSLDVFLIYTGRDLPEFGEMQALLKTVIGRFEKSVPHG